MSAVRARTDKMSRENKKTFYREEYKFASSLGFLANMSRIDAF